MIEGQAGLTDHIGVDHHHGRKMMDGLVSLDSDKTGKDHQVKTCQRKRLSLMMLPPSWNQDLVKWRVR